MKDRRHSDYVPSEVLVYHLRQTKSDNSDGRFVALYDIFRDRVEAACPRPNRHVDDTVYEDSRIAEIRDATIDHVTELMFTDRQCSYEQEASDALVSHWRSPGPSGACRRCRRQAQIGQACSYGLTPNFLPLPSYFNQS